MGTEETKGVETENSAEMERKVKKEKIVYTNPTSFGAAEPEARPEVQVFKSAMKKYCFIRNTSLNDPENKY